VRREQVLGGQGAQGLQAFADLLGGHVLARPLGRDLEAVAAVDERVADDERSVALDPEHEVVRLHPRERLDADGQAVARLEHPAG
jgi:hypothetical protein